MIHKVYSKGNARCIKSRRSLDSTRSICKGGYYFVQPSHVRGGLDVYTLNGNPLGDFSEDIFVKHLDITKLKDFK